MLVLVKIGTKLDLVLELAIKGTFYLWIILSFLISLILNQTFDFTHLLTTLIFNALIFLPMYFVLISISLNDKYKRRIITTFLSIIPVIICYLILAFKMNFIAFEIGKILFLLSIMIMINFSLTIQNKPYYLIIITLINCFSSIVIYINYMLNTINMEQYKIIGLYSGNSYLLETSLIVVISISVILTYFYYLVIFNKIRKDELNA